MKAVALVIAVFTISVAASGDNSVELLLRYAIEFGGAFGGTVVVLLPFLTKLIRRMDRMDDAVLAVHDRLDRAGFALTPGRTQGQRPRNNSGRFRALQQPSSSSSDDKTAGPTPDKGK